MADEVQIAPGEGIAKIRHPVGVAVLTLITLGIYGLYWWYQVNREMVDLGKARNVDGLGDNPTTSLLAFFPGGLVILPPFFSLYNGTQRMKRAQEVTTGSTPTLNGWIIVILLIVGLSIVAYGYMQAELNKAWRALPAGAVESGAPAGQIEQPPQQPAQQPEQPSGGGA
jgi:ABC-type arginine transport system permease subunit